MRFRWSFDIHEAKMSYPPASVGGLNLRQLDLMMAHRFIKYGKVNLHENCPLQGKYISTIYLHVKKLLIPSG